MKNPSLIWVFIAYGLGGVGIGTFESNLLSTVAPLGNLILFYILFLFYFFI